MPWLYSFARGLLRLIVPLVFRVEYEGRGELPKGGGYLLAGNHTSYLDPVVLALGMRPRLRFMAKQELTSRPLGRWLFAGGLGVVPVERGAGDMSAIHTCADLLRRGEVLGIFPEGTRRPAGEPGRPKSGMALIAKMTGADVLPAAVEIERPIRFRGRITVRFGRLIPAGELGLQDDSPRALKRATKRVWGEVLTLLGVEDDEA